MFELPVECRLQAPCESDEQDDHGEHAEEQRDQTEDEPSGGIDNRGRCPVAHGADQSDDRVGRFVGPVRICQRIPRHRCERLAALVVAHLTKQVCCNRERSGSGQRRRPSNDRATVGLVGHGFTGDVVDADNYRLVEQAWGIPAGWPDNPSDQATQREL